MSDRHLAPVTTGTCPACGSTAQPLVANLERHGYVAFHERCEAVLIANRLADGIAATLRERRESS